MRHFTRILAILLFPMFIMAQSAPPSKGTPAPVKQPLATTTTAQGTAATAPSRGLTTEQRLTLVSSYQRALLSQNAALAAQQKAQNDAISFYSSCASITKELGKEEGTMCNVNVDTGEVTFVAPLKEGKK